MQKAQYDELMPKIDLTILRLLDLEAFVPPGYQLQRLYYSSSKEFAITDKSASPWRLEMLERSLWLRRELFIQEDTN